MSSAILLEVSQACKTPVEDIEDVFSCTPAQLGMFVESVKRPGAYHTLVIGALAPAVDEDRLRTAIEAATTIHSAYRSRIVECCSGLVQVVMKSPVRVMKPPQGMDEYKKEAALFGLGTPLFNAAIIDRKLVCAMHHAVYDDTAWRLFQYDVKRAYCGEPPLERSPFKDFVQSCSAIDEDEAVAFWQSQFRAHAFVFPRVEQNTSCWASSVVGGTIAMPANRRSVPVSLIPAYIETAWALTTQDYNGCSSTVFGKMMSGRTVATLDRSPTAGPTIAVVPVQIDVPEEATVAEMIRSVAESQRRLLGSNVLHYGITKISRLGHAARTAASFQTIINIRSSDESRNPLSEIGVSEHYVCIAPQPYPLALEFTIGATGFEVEARYDPCVLSDAQVRRLVSHLQHILQRLLRAPPQLKLASIPRITAKDRQQLFEWNKIVPKHVEGTLPGSMAHRHRHSLASTNAIEAADGSLTYSELDSLSERLAHELRARGASAGSAVAFHFEKSKWAMVAVLAILKSGATCVALAPEHPAMRKKTIIDAAGARIVLTSPRLLEESNDLLSEVVIVSEPSLSCLPDQGRIAHQPSSSDAAYIVFTSGSTGTPKGAVLEHRNLLSTILAKAKRLMETGLEPRRVLQMASFVWDASIEELWLPLLLGGTICMPSEAEREAALAEYIQRENIDTATLTPPVLRTISTESIPCVKLLCSAGEAVDPRAFKTWGSRANAHFFNAWGPTEASICSTITELTPHSAHPTAIGKPIGCAIWIVDHRNHNKLLPIGAVGEMVVEGPGVARHYLKDEVRTAEAFIDAPLWAPRREGVRMYKTGDLARFVGEDGTVAFVGRKDSQVKRNGQRFELGDVEHALTGHPGVREAFVTLEGKDLIAVLTLVDDQLPRTTVLGSLCGTAIYEHWSAIGEHVRSRLPRYMHPSSWIFVERLPWTPTGKTDRMAIRDWLKEQDLNALQTALHVTIKQDITPPSTSTERALQDIWSVILKLPSAQIGKESYWTRLGGDSITGMQAAARCRKLGMHIRLATLLTENLAEIAAQCNGSASITFDARVSSSLQLSPAKAQHLKQNLDLEPSEVEAIYPCTAMQEGIALSQVQGGEKAFVTQFLRRVLHKDHEVVDVQRLAEAWRIVCQRYPVLRTVICSGLDTESRFQQVVLKATQPRIKVLRVESAFDADHFKLETTHFNCSEPRHSFTIVQAPDAALHIFLEMDHALYDAVSTKIIDQAVSEAYVRGSLSARDEPTFAHYVAWQRGQHASANKYWRRQLRGIKPSIFLVDAVEPGEPVRKTTSYLNIPSIDASRLRDFCKTQRVSMSNVFHAAWATVLRALLREDTVLFGTVYSARDAFPGAERVPGPTMSIVPCKVDFLSTTSHQDLLRQLQHSTSHALERSACNLLDVAASLGIVGPMFNTVLTVRGLGEERLMDDDLQINTLKAEMTAGMPITVVVEWDTDLIRAYIAYHDALVSQDSARTIALALTDVILSMIEDPTETIAPSLAAP